MDLFSVLRVVVSLAVVLGAIWYIQRRVAKKNGGRAAKRVPVQVLGRASLGGKASAVVIETGGTRLVLGVTEHGVTVLTTQDAPVEETEEVPVAAAIAAPAVTPAAATPVPDAVPAVAVAPVFATFETDPQHDAERLAASWAASAPSASAAPAPIAPRRAPKAKPAAVPGLAKPVIFRDAAGNPATLDGLREGGRRLRALVGI